MNISILLQHFTTMGGGEKYGGTIAECLSKVPRNKVKLICNQGADINKFQQRLNLDLSKVEIILTDDFSVSNLEKLTNESDMFVNATYRSTFISKCKKNYLVIYFPEIIRKSKFLIHMILNFTSYIIFRILLQNYIFDSKGFYGSEIFHGFSVRWSSATIEISNINRSNKLVLNCYDTRRVDLKNAIKFIVNEDKKKLTFDIIDNNQIVVNINKSKEIIISLNTSSPKEKYLNKLSNIGKNLDSRELGICVKEIFTSNNIVHRFWRSFFRLYPLNRFVNRLQRYKFNRENMVDPKKLYLSYDKLVVISEYSNDWLKKTYQINSAEMLYPPIDTEIFLPLPKEKIILNVGRFFVSNHNKKQLELLKIFKQMKSEYPNELKDWKFYAVGGSHKEKIHQDYLSECKKLSDGQNIFVIEDIPFPDLVKLMGKASIYWHATGFGENVNKDPDRFEHFGITTVEAMSAGAVPVVINMAGQKETVEEGNSGYLWNTSEQLQELTLNLISNPKLLSEISHNAEIRSKFFSKNNFVKESLRIFEK